jgi:uncharacterized membrane protein YgaE (UPF0421/DUF939 family)
MYTRIANRILSVGMGAAAGLNLSSTDVSTAVIACYVMAFSCLICCYETHLKQVHMTIAVNFGFLYNAKGRIVFLAFVGMLLFNLGLIGIIVGSAMVANLAAHVYILFRYPEFEEYQRKDAQAEIKEYLDNHPELGEQAVRAGANFAASNPDLMRKGAEAYVNSQRNSAGYNPPSGGYS